MPFFSSHRCDAAQGGFFCNFLKCRGDAEVMYHTSAWRKKEIFIILMNTKNSLTAYFDDHSCRIPAKWDFPDVQIKKFN